MAKVLIVEDNELNMKLFQDLLKIKRHEVILSTNGENILSLVIDKKPDLILMDIQLGGLSGIDLIRILKKDKMTNHIPIIAITAFATKQDEMIISSCGCNLYLTKPVSINDFFIAIEGFVGNV